MMKPFDVEALLQTARERTGLSDFGPEDFREGLEVFVAGLNAQGEVSEERWHHVHEWVQRLLMNRLWFAKDLAEHPEIADEEIGSPVVIASLPRTGSTKMHRLLGAAGDFQILQFWKAHMFARIPGEPLGGEVCRIQETRDFEKWMYEISPEILTGHPMFTDEPEEDQWLQQSSFRQAMFAGMFPAAGYSEWLVQADQQPTYDYFRAQLKYLQWQYKPAVAAPWLLKSPNHLGKERDLSKVFKKPRFIVTHRDPAKCIPSITSTGLYLRRLYIEHADARGLAPIMMALVAHMAAEHVKWRDENPDAEVLDLGFREINEDGVGAARKVYEFLGMPFSAKAEKAMREWERNNAREKHGKNVYSLEMIDATEDSIHQAFASYIERYSKFF